MFAPNITNYNKLKKDFGDNNSPKYVFKGLDKFVTPPRIIDGDNYDQFRQTSLDSGVTINVFNIDKLRSDSKAKDGKPGRIKRLTEILGESYFEYLQSLPDLCVFMDESHHYHADKSFAVINELNPILGVEVTATPQIQKGSKTTHFKNIVYEYSLAHALNDERYVKVPCVVTRKDFDPTQYTDEEIEHEKLKDGTPMNNGTPYFWLKEFCQKHGLPFYGIHSFRHLFASLLVNQGVDIVTVSGALGHSSVSTTSNIYCHMLQEAQAKVSDAVANALDFSKKKEPEDT